MPTKEDLVTLLEEIETTYNRIEQVTKEYMSNEFQTKVSAMNTYKGTGYDSKAMGSSETIREAFILDQNQDIFQKTSDSKIKLASLKIYLECLQTKLKVYELIFTK